jgi:hypothetical protein
MKRIELTEVLNTLYEVREGFHNVLMHSVNKLDYKKEFTSLIETAQMMDEFNKNRMQQMKEEELSEEELKLLEI